MGDDEWARLDALADEAHTSASKVLRVALARLEAAPGEISDEAWRLSDNKYREGSPAANQRAEEAAAAVS